MAKAPDGDEIQAPPKLSEDAPEFQPGGTNWKPELDKEAAVETPEKEAKPPKDEFGGLLRGGFWNYELGWWMPFHVGTLKSFNVRTGYGFLECEATHGIYGTDVYIHKSQVMMPWRIGQPVEFAVTQNNRGQPQACDVMWLPMTGPPRSKEPQEQNKRQEKQNERNKWYIGTLKSYSPSQGYGFIGSEDMLEMHSCDVYLDRGQLPQSQEWRPGQVVEFEVNYNRRGQPQAKSVNWDPITLMHRDQASGAPSRAVDIAGVRNLNKVAGHLRQGDRTAAIKVAMELQESAETIDYLSFALERMGAPSRAMIEELAEGTPILLLIKLSGMLSKNEIPAPRIPQAVTWCEMALPLLSPHVIGASSDMRFENVISLVQRNLETAAASPLQLVDSSTYQGVLAQLSETARHA